MNDLNLYLYQTSSCDRNFIMNQTYYLPQSIQNFYNSCPKTNYFDYSINSSFQSKTSLVQQNYPNWTCAYIGDPYPSYHSYSPNGKLENSTGAFCVNKKFPDNLGIRKTKKVRRDRTNYTKIDLQILENYFQQNSYPDINAREKIALKIHVSELHIQVWFKNRRAKQRRLSKNADKKKSISIIENDIKNADNVSKAKEIETDNGTERENSGNTEIKIAEDHCAIAAQNYSNTNLLSNKSDADFHTSYTSYLKTSNISNYLQQLYDSTL